MEIPPDRFIQLSTGTPGLRTCMHVEVREALPSPGGEGQGEGELPSNSCNWCLDFISSDESLDRYNEIISASGWKLENYQRNPVFQNAHQTGDIIFTLGRAITTEVRQVGRESSRAVEVGRVCPQTAAQEVGRESSRAADEVGRAVPSAPLPSLGGEGQGEGEHLSRQGHSTSSYLFQRIQFACDINPMARIAYGLYKGKFLNAVSVGFVPIRWETPNENPERMKDNSPGQTRNEWRPGSEAQNENSLSPSDGERVGVRGPGSPKFRRRFLEQELLEVSAVGIPANPNALALGLKSGAIQKSDLKDTLDLFRSTLATPESDKGERRISNLLPRHELLRLLLDFHSLLKQS